MGFGNILKTLGGIGSIAGAPFTAGTSLSWLPAVLGGAAAVGGALENTKGARTTTTTPTIAPEYKTLADLLRSRAEDRLRSNLDMSGYTASGISGINDVFKGLQQSSANNLTARGLATSPIAGVVGTNLDLARGGNIVDFLNTIPLLQRQFQNEDMGIAQNVLGLGRGTTSVGPGSVAAGAINSGVGSVAKLLGLLHGQGVFGSKTPGLGTGWEVLMPEADNG